VLDIKVEIGLDLGDSTPIGFRLDDAVRGVLGNTLYVLAGTIFYDISDRIKSVSTKRGKSQALDRIDAGIASITLDNSDRTFDPLYSEGPYFGALVPRREIRITAETVPVFYGFIEDFDLEYQPGNRATVRIDAADAFSVLANATIDELEPPSELSGARVTRVLDLPEVNWPSDLRQIDEGNSLLLDSSASGLSALEYLQTVANSEFGNLFVSRLGQLVFQERNSTSPGISTIFTDDLTFSPPFVKIPYSAVQAIYGSENLYTRIQLSNTDVIPEEVEVENETASTLYGVRTYSASNLLVQEPEQLQDLANYLLVTYENPLFRFEAVQVIIDKLDVLQTASVLDLEIGDIVQVRFQPSNIPPAIELPARIIGISHDWDTTLRRVSFTLETLNFGVFVLNSELFGQLDDDRLGY
jgi:hypothetical protein